MEYTVNFDRTRREDHLQNNTFELIMVHCLFVHAGLVVQYNQTNMG